MLFRTLADNQALIYRSTLLEQAGVPHAFSTRIGGVSAAPFDSLNFGNPADCATPDPGERIAANYQLLLVAAGCRGRRLCEIHQVHGSSVAHIDDPVCHNQLEKADAIVTSNPACVCAIRTADCAPILLASTDGRHVAAVHAGWRGVVNDVLPRAIDALRERTDVPLLAAIGPCISADAFEVGPEVLAEFERRFGGSAPIRQRGDGKGHADIRDALRLQLLECGIPVDRIDLSDRCTVRHADEFFSHRRDHGMTGRMASVISPAL
jgi:polyphenol oxidase